MPKIGLWRALVINACIKAYNKFSGLKQYTFIISVYLDQEFKNNLTVLSGQGLTRLQSMCQQDYRRRTRDSPSSFRLLAEIWFLQLSD